MSRYITRNIAPASRYGHATAPGAPQAWSAHREYHSNVVQRSTSPKVRLRVDLGPAHAIGPGKIALLEQIDRTGSLSQAARELRMSYRRAWLLLDDLNHTFTQPATAMSIGGSGGGGARLTPFGKRLVAAYRGHEQATEELAVKQLEWLAEECAAARSGSTASSASRQRLAQPLSRQSGARARRSSGADSAPDTRGRATKRL